MGFVGENPSIWGQKLHPAPPRYEHDLRSQDWGCPGPGVSTMKGSPGFPGPGNLQLQVGRFFCWAKIWYTNFWEKKLGRILVITCENMIVSMDIRIWQCAVKSSVKLWRVKKRGPFADSKVNELSFQMVKTSSPNHPQIAICEGHPGCTGPASAAQDHLWSEHHC